MSKPIRHWPFFVSAFLLIATPAHADSDVQLWTEAGITYDISKRFRLGIDQHIRLEDNASRVERIMPDVHLRWRPKKWVYFQLGYRFLGQPQYSLGETYWDAWHRPYGDAGLRRKFGDFGVSYRLRYQEQFGWPWDEDGELVTEHTVRNRLGLHWYAGRDWSLGIENELWVRIDDPDGALHKWRTTLALDWDLGDHDASVFVGRDKALDDELEPNVYIIGLAYHFDL